VLKALFRRGKLRSGILCRHQGMSQLSCFGIFTAIPAEMFARHSNSGVLPIELIQRFEVLKNDLCLRSAQEWRCYLSCRDEVIDIAKDPWCALRGATDHYSFRAGEIKYGARLLR